MSIDIINHVFKALAPSSAEKRSELKCTPIPEPTEELLQRFLANVVERESGCHEWTGHTTEGYGGISIHGYSYRAHRVSYRFFVGPIPDGLMVLHECDNRLCVNPQHLFVGTAMDNTRDMIAKGRSSFAPRSKDVCSRGHLISEVGKSKRGECAQCNRDRALAYYHAHRSPASAATVDKPYITSHDKNDAPHAGLGTAEAGDPNYDGAPYCSHCGASKARWCTCGPIASNE